jgi:hypothetical protein
MAKKKASKKTAKKSTKKTTAKKAGTLSKMASAVGRTARKAAATTKAVVKQGVAKTTKAEVAVLNLVGATDMAKKEARRAGGRQAAANKASRAAKKM